MNMEIKNIGGVEYAYVYENGRVFKTIVEDLTQGDTLRVPQSRPTIVPQISERTTMDEADVVQRPPGKPRPSIMPPGLAGVFKPAGSAGAAEELRTV